MKNFKMTLIALFALVFVNNVNAQDSDNPWAISLGLNAVDFYGSGNGFGDNVKDLFGNSDWNVIPSISTMSATKYIQNGFSLQIAGSLNKIETLNSKNDSNMMYYAVDANVRYDVNKLVDLVFGTTTKWFDPYVFLGTGYTSVGGNGSGTINFGLGSNTWLKENVGINFQTGTKKGFSNVQAHYQTSLGLVFKFKSK